MIVPKRHVSLFTDLTNDELISIKGLVSTLFNAFHENGQGDGFNLLSNNGQVAGQHIPHFHLHLFIRKEGETSPFDVLSKKIAVDKITKDEWDSRLKQIRSWFE
jgi:diadenosine tetraphosphate (Ap4A) HIT family hydrolase